MSYRLSTWWQEDSLQKWGIFSVQAPRYTTARKDVCDEEVSVIYFPLLLVLASAGNGRVLPVDGQCGP